MQEKKIKIYYNLYPVIYGLEAIGGWSGYADAGPGRNNAVSVSDKFTQSAYFGHGKL